MCGKNFNYFDDGAPREHPGVKMVEIWPSPPHLVRSVDVRQPCQRALPVQEQIMEETPRAPPEPTFYTVEQALFPEVGVNMLTRGRGGSCCLPLEYTDSQGYTSRLWMGVEHSKTPSQRHGIKRLPAQLQPNHYISRLYAFERTSPYRLVARSGYFCLGFPTEDECNDNHPPLVRATAWRKLALGANATFDCPRIHFISGMVLDVENPSHVLVAYGVNDCLSRIVRVRLSELQRLLFVGPSSA